LKCGVISRHGHPESGAPFVTLHCNDSILASKTKNFGEIEGKQYINLKGKKMC